MEKYAIIVAGSCNALSFFSMWSDVGIETQVSTNEEVKCITNHLTSFAVLVDHQGLIGSASSSSPENNV